MPKTKPQQKRWDRAEEIVAEQKEKKKPKGDDYALVQHIYQGMKATEKEKKKKKSELSLLHRLHTVANTLEDTGFNKAARLIDAVLAGEAGLVVKASENGDKAGLG